MAKGGSKKATRARMISGKLREIVDGLPSHDDRDAMAASLEALVEYLSDAKRALQGIPTRDGHAELMTLLDRFDSLLSQAEDSPVLARALGVEKRLSKKVTTTPKVVDPRQVRSVLEGFRDSTIDQIREKLLDDSKYTASELRQMAASIGLRVQSRSNRSTVAAQLVTAIANERGYRQLRSDPS